MSDFPPTDDEDLDFGKYHLIAPCIEKGVSLKKRAIETGVHRSTLARLVRRFEAGGIDALERKPRSDKGTFEIAPELTELIKAHIIVQPNQSLATIQRLVARICANQGWVEPSYRTVYSIHKTIPKDLLTLSKDRAEYKKFFEIIHRFEATYPNEIWQADHNFMDIFVWDQYGQAMKPVLTAVLDDYSRAITGYYLDFNPPSAQRTATALRQAIWYKTNPKWLACGIPDKLYTDSVARHRIGVLCRL